ncbi:calcium-binding protein [Flavimobilis marinus]|uniref:Sugar lactone lactonase YvrE n=1 Tax=Flavimobilis marinus TaxID=285351 RepID=A0A1I2HS43_9MICO|nr:SMP-30/gluconolactonase/LRE family protein [Flavimobilis marinus]GHG48791.1 calcium-binding protein [Flavimobilis marinus]SFF32388.1 Sugar lactone lactonase YvrE [Flavimobilis marinus]
MTTIFALPASTDVFELGEGPFWDADRDRLLWVDIPSGNVHAGRVDLGTLTPDGTSLTGTADTARVTITTDETHAIGEFATLVVPDADGRLLVGARSALVVVEPDGTVRPAVDVLDPTEERRLNDGACDPAGRMLVGTLALDGPTGSEVLVRLEDDGSLTTLDDDLQLSNGLAWTPDGTFYSADTEADVIRARAYDAETGEVGPRREVVRFEDGKPDGLCLDSDGNLWVALYGTGEVRCVSPEGEVLHTVVTGIPATTSVAFVGPDLDVLVITTGREGLDADDREALPDAGRIFVAPVGAELGLRGAPVPLWNGRGA